MSISIPQVDVWRIWFVTLLHKTMWLKGHVSLLVGALKGMAMAYYRTCYIVGQGMAEPSEFWWP